MKGDLWSTLNIFCKSLHPPLEYLLLSKVRPHLSGNASEKHPKNTEVCRHHCQQTPLFTNWTKNLAKYLLIMQFEDALWNLEPIFSQEIFHPRLTCKVIYHRQHNIPHSIWLSKIGKDSECKNEKTIAKGSLASMQGSLFLCKSLKILPACLVCLNLFLYFCKE